MLKFKTKPRKWGNSIGIALPKDIVKKANIKSNKELEIFIPEKKVNLKEIFGSLKSWKKSTEKIMREIDEGWN